MTLMEILSGKAVLVGLKGQNKREILEELVDMLEVGDKIMDREKVLEAVLLREEIMSTGIGHGIAIPHGKLESLEKLHGIFARLERPVEFESIDERPVDLIFLLLAPESAGADHLKALARVSRLLRDKTVCEKLRGSESPEALYALLIEQSSNRAA